MATNEREFRGILNSEIREKFAAIRAHSRCEKYTFAVYFA